MHNYLEVLNINQLHEGMFQYFFMNSRYNSTDSSKMVGNVSKVLSINCLQVVIFWFFFMNLSYISQIPLKWLVALRVIHLVHFKNDVQHNIGRIKFV